MNSESSDRLNGAAESVGSGAGQLFPLVYTELRRLAAVQMAREKPGHTLQPKSD